MTIQICLFQPYYPIEWRDPALSKSSYQFPTPAHVAAKSFLPSAGLMYIPRPSARRRALNCFIDRLEDCELPGSEYVIAHLYDKYRKNLTETTIRQSGQVLIAFLLFFQGIGKQRIEEVTRKDIDAYVEYEQERGADSSARSPRPSPRISPFASSSSANTRMRFSGPGFPGRSWPARSATACGSCAIFRTTTRILISGRRPRG